MINNGEIILRIILSTIFGGLIGMEREANNRPAGLRTHILVSLGSTLIMLVSIDGFYDIENGVILGDPARLAAQVVSGIGFLGAGTILRTGNHIKGLTTAASLWVCAGIGLAIGNGYYLGAIFTVGMVLLTLKSLSNLEERIFKSKYKTLEITALDRTGLIGEIGILLGNNNIAIKDITILNVDDNDDNDLLKASFKVKLPLGVDIEKLFFNLCKISGMLEASFQGEKYDGNYAWYET